jgi:hypothetical protein
MELALEDGGGTAMAFKDGGSAAALRGGLGWQLMIAAAALGSGEGRRTCNDSAGISAVKAKGLLLQRRCQCR